MKVISGTFTASGSAKKRRLPLAGPVLARPVLARPVLARPVLARPVLADPACEVDR
jgi:hypothetical protein